MAATAATAAPPRPPLPMAWKPGEAWPPAFACPGPPPCGLAAEAREGEEAALGGAPAAALLLLLLPPPPPVLVLGARAGAGAVRLSALFRELKPPEAAGV